MTAMRLSRLQEEILIVLTNSDRPLYSKELSYLLNEGSKLGTVTEQTINSTANRMVKQELLLKEKGDKYNKAWYSISDFGLYCLFEARDNRKRLEGQFDKLLKAKPQL